MAPPSSTDPEILPLYKAARDSSSTHTSPYYRFTHTPGTPAGTQPFTQIHPPTQAPTAPTQAQVDTQLQCLLLLLLSPLESSLHTHLCLCLPPTHVAPSCPQDTVGTLVPAKKPSRPLSLGNAVPPPAAPTLPSVRACTPPAHLVTLEYSVFPLCCQLWGTGLFLCFTHCHVPSSRSLDLEELLKNISRDQW